MNSSARNFKNVLPALFVGAAMGTGIGFFMAKHGTNPLVNKRAELRTADATAKTDADPNANSDTSAEGNGTTPKVPVMLGGATRSDAVSGDDAQATGPIQYAPPSGDVIKIIGDRNVMPGVVQTKEFDEKLRETYTTEILPDGSNASRTYREDGSMKSEQVDLADGSELERSFFEGGGTKAANYKHPDGSITSASYDSTGVPSEMMTTFPDHTTVFNEYDDHGKVLGVWQHFPDGRTEPYDGSEGSTESPPLSE